MNLNVTKAFMLYMGIFLFFAYAAYAAPHCDGNSWQTAYSPADLSLQVHYGPGAGKSQQKRIEILFEGKPIYTQITRSDLKVESDKGSFEQIQGRAIFFDTCLVLRDRYASNLSDVFYLQNVPASFQVNPNYLSCRITSEYYIRRQGTPRRAQLIYDEGFGYSEIVLSSSESGNAEGAIFDLQGCEEFIWSLQFKIQAKHISVKNLDKFTRSQ